jgi:hypothetical protein
VTADILIREDTGTHAVVRVIEPDPVSAPYSRAVGLLDRWVADERHAVDEFAAWLEGQAAQAHAEMRLLCDELGLPVAWAEVPEPLEPRTIWLPPRRPSDVLAEAYRGERGGAAEAYMRADTSDDMPGRSGWTPTRPVIVIDIPAPDLVQAGPQGRFARWFDEQLQRAERWWRGKQAARDQRLGVGDE